MIIRNLFPSFCELPDACRDARLVRPPPTIMYIRLPFALRGRTNRASLHACLNHMVGQTDKVWMAIWPRGDGFNLYFVVEKQENRADCFVFYKKSAGFCKYGLPFFAYFCP